MNHNTCTDTAEFSVQKGEEKNCKIFSDNFLVKHHYLHFNEYDFRGSEDHIAERTLSISTFKKIVYDPISKLKIIWHSIV